jgi:hypothetical protein
VVKQVYRVKYDGRKDKSSDLNSTIEKPITLLKNLANDGKEVEKSSMDVVGAKFKQKKMKVPTIKKELPLSKIEAKLTCSIGLLKWQEKKLQKLSAEKLREEGFAWVPRGSIQAHKDNAQVVRQRQRREEDSRNNCQVGGLHQIIKIIGHGIIHALCLSLCGIHSLVCMVIP